ncbi:unnamed protein product [[Actinomadura] parvosata subsp. kistnae]|nr:unnamed protein product [Actinomadura parvosata subsp. kistnae]
MALLASRGRALPHAVRSAPPAPQWGASAACRSGVLRPAVVGRFGRVPCRARAALLRPAPVRTCVS